MAWWWVRAGDGGAIRIGRRLMPVFLRGRGPPKDCGIVPRLLKLVFAVARICCHAET